MSMSHETFQRIVVDLRNSPEGESMSDEDLYDEAYRRMSTYFERSDKDIVKEYFVSLIVGVIFTYVLWEVVLVIAADIPELYKYGIAIGITVVVVLYNVVKRKLWR